MQVVGLGITQRWIRATNDEGGDIKRQSDHASNPSPDLDRHLDISNVHHYVPSPVPSGHGTRTKPSRAVPNAVFFRGAPGAQMIPTAVEDSVQGDREANLHLSRPFTIEIFLFKIFRPPSTTMTSLERRPTTAVFRHTQRAPRVQTSGSRCSCSRSVLPTCILHRSRGFRASG